MSRVLFIVISATFLALILAAPAHALRCNHRVIQVGDTVARVADHCGPPDHVTSWQEEIYEGGVYSPKRRGRPSGRFRGRYAKRIIVSHERWIYNFGSTRLIRHLTFENGILKKIETGGRGG